MARLHLSLVCSRLLALAAPSPPGNPDLLQDACVADLASSIKQNGFHCKVSVTLDDFFFAGLKKTGNTSNPVGLAVTAANMLSFPGVNTLGVSMALIHYAKGGQNPPHTHPRATDIIYVTKGMLEVGFITTANKLLTKTLNEGRVFVFPRGLVHFQHNRGYGPAPVIAGFNSQLQGTQVIANTLFAAAAQVPTDVLAKAFRVGNDDIEAVKARFK